MNKKADEPNRAAEQRQRAEEQARDESHGKESEIHELRVYQIELEMQNEELRRAHAELDIERVRYFDLYDLAPVGYVTLSEQGTILEANLTAASLLGVERCALVKQPFTRFILKEDADVFYLQRQKAIKTGTTQVCDLRMLKIDGVEFWTRLDMTAAHGADGELVSLVTLSDITERKLAEAAVIASDDKYRTVELQTSLYETQQTLAHLATHDALTGILNRRAILEQLSKELSRAQRNDQLSQGKRKEHPSFRLSIGFFDIDHFKQINDQYGHQAGDEVLKGIVGILTSQLRPYDSFGRLGGDEFLVVAPDTNAENCKQLFERLATAIGECRVMTGAGEVSITVSIGAVSSESDPFRELDTLLESADAAMYRAKRSGGNCMVFADKEIADDTFKK